VAKTDLGTKRLCGSCGAKFYDLDKTPIVCPKCETVFVVPVVTSRSRPAEPVAAPVVKPVPAAVAVEPETADAEFVSLEDADAEATGKKPAAGAEAAEGEEVAADDTLDDAAFIEEQDEGDPDVTDIIGEAAEKEEET
jgi:uncharacterized protein (TIGR02300 family)